MSKIRKIKKEGNLPDYYYVLPNDDRIDILVLRSKKGNTYTNSCSRPSVHNKRIICIYGQKNKKNNFSKSSRNPCNRVTFPNFPYYIRAY